MRRMELFFGGITFCLLGFKVQCPISSKSPYGQNISSSWAVHNQAAAGLAHGPSSVDPGQNNGLQEVRDDTGWM